jgi:hypothetical protein
MKLPKTTKISLEIIFLFSIQMAISFIPETFREFFGDWYCNGAYLGKDNLYDCSYFGRNIHNPCWHWGYRHWIFFAMGAVLFVIQAIHLFNKNSSGK